VESIRLETLQPGSQAVAFDQVDVLGVPVACLDVAGMLDLVRRWSFEPARRTILYVNAHCLNTAARDSQYHAILNRADLVYSDGISVVWSARWLDGRRLHKMTGADWIYDFAAWAQAAGRHEPEGIRIYILAGKPGIAHDASHNLRRMFPDINIVGAYDGFFQEKSQAAVLQDIAQSKPHVLFVGMGTPLQEKWIAEHRDQIAAPVCWAVGALFDYVAGIEPRVPAWMNALALEWLFRMLIDPAGKWRRYLIGNPLFVLRILRQKLGSTTHSR
jgi:N-acetylglucosaminyldiphosphoundecaprenol N-acetyl-beta-D-mannosaminyltransferase